MPAVPPDDFGLVEAARAAPEDGSAGPRLTPFAAAPARQTRIADAVPRETLHRFENGWRLTRVPRARWNEEHNCLKALGYRTLYDQAPTEQHTSAWTICRLENADGRFRQQVGLTLHEDEVGFELSPPSADQETAAECVNQLFRDLELGPWRATCNHGPSGKVELAFEWGSEGYSPEEGAHLCPVCRYPFPMHRAALTPAFTRVFGAATRHSQAEQV